VQIINLVLVVLLASCAFWAGHYCLRHCRWSRIVDWRIPALVAIILNALDLLTTRIALVSGSSAEGNYLPSLILTAGENWFILHKLATGSLISVALAWGSLRRPNVRTVALAWIFALTAAVIWNTLTLVLVN